MPWVSMDGITSRTGLPESISRLPFTPMSVAWVMNAKAMNRCKNLGCLP